MGSKVIHTPEGSIIVDSDFDEESLDTSSMLPEELRIPKEVISYPEVPQDTILVNEDKYVGHIRTYSISENKLTKRKVIKVIIDCLG